MVMVAVAAEAVVAAAVVVVLPRVGAASVVGEVFDVDTQGDREKKLFTEGEVFFGGGW